MANNHRRCAKTPKHKRNRRSAAKKACAAKWKATCPTVSTPSSPVSFNQTHTESSLKGARVMDLKILSTSIQEVSEHAIKCKGKCSISSEIHREGLASILEVKCDDCDETFSIKSSKKILGSGDVKKIQCKRWCSVGTNVDWWRAEMSQ